MLKAENLFQPKDGSLGEALLCYVMVLPTRLKVISNASRHGIHILVWALPSQVQPGWVVALAFKGGADLHHNWREKKEGSAIWPRALT